ncbi:MAG: hypothetical protein HY794_13515 [Desulfarculus sp.]|nr:hypothetical protein [Desulfarculus sp.]
MFKPIKLLCYATFLCFGCFSFAHAEQDVLGWDKAKWGATHADIAKSYQLHPWVAEGSPRCDAVDPVVVNGVSFRVRFFFDTRSDAGNLSHVALIRSGAPVDDKALVGLLSSKYGPPNQQSRAYRGGVVYSWFKPSGRVELTVDRSIMAAGEQSVIIDYVSTTGDKGKI